MALPMDTVPGTTEEGYKRAGDVPDQRFPNPGGQKKLLGSIFFRNTNSHHSELLTNAHDKWMSLKMIMLREAKQKQVYSYGTRLLSHSRKCRLTFNDAKQMVAAW